MYLQKPSASRYSLGPSNFSTPTAEQQQPKLVPFTILRSGLCISSKRLSTSLTSGRRHGGFVRVRCVGKDDGFYIRRCVEIARKGIGCTSPNPMVGCVIVKDGKIVGEGFHPKAGQPHAEVFALRDAGNLAENATAYVSLEPCNHYGRTPPCTEALIKAKVKKVVVGMVDPNPIVASKGVNRLRDAGIDVTVGVEEELCKKLIEAWIHQMLTGKPFVTLRYSLSIDGHFSDQLGEEATKSGGYYSQLLQEYDAVILSSTLLGENFSLPVSEEPGANQPLQIIIARNPSSPIEVPVLTTEASSKVVVFTDNETTVEPEMVQKGIEPVVLDGMNLITILDYCKQPGLCSVLLDIRGNIGDFEEMLREGFEGNLFQKVVVEMVPIWKGSKEERFPVAFTSLGPWAKTKVEIFIIKKLMPKCFVGGIFFIEMIGPMDKSTKTVELNWGFDLNNSFSATRNPVTYNIEEKVQWLKDIQESPVDSRNPSTLLSCAINSSKPYREFPKSAKSAKRAKHRFRDRKTCTGKTQG